MKNLAVRGLRVAVLAADGFEQVELTKPVKALQQSGAVVEVVSLRPGHIRGMNLLIPGKKVAVDRVLSEADPTLYDALLLPGGFMSPDFLRQSEQALAFVRAFDTVRKPIAVICHGPWVLVSADMVRGRRLTSWPGIKHDIINAGGSWEDATVVRDDNWVSSRSPQDLPAFNQAMLELFAAATPLRPHGDIATRRVSVLPKLLAGALALLGLGFAVRQRSSFTAQPSVPATKPL